MPKTKYTFRAWELNLVHGAAKKMPIETWADIEHLRGIIEITDFTDEERNLCGWEIVEEANAEGQIEAPWTIKKPHVEFTRSWTNGQVLRVQSILTNFGVQRWQAGAFIKFILPILTKLGWKPPVTNTEEKEEEDGA